ncbi:LysR family transcriptional regulator [Nocardia otitidiscaviarum]|uniref:LysR family transcriptional regulator n=1 Tax=Nocardia otitidiscaviarum TaxID=1823 RepID=UPI0004A7695A|nr:LysR substrate-binding domain-containing protein [Nocardia otitidiscaviarum]MBF6133410.1 LysR family transcriptional regulator [Nocardia otitidiscaviarum]MBF6486806.1 LysR family transcriptional regulator [Nocardia otitidiscaviarum]
MLERHELEAFLVLAEELHFGRTAERLRVTTARVSQTIAKMERRLGVPLFERSSRRVRTTPAGRELYAELRPAWDRVTAAVRRTMDTGRGRAGTLEVAFVDAATGQLLVRAAELFRARLPDVAVRLREAQPAQVIPWLHAGEIDMALDMVPFPAEGITAGPDLVTEARLLAVPAAHPFADRTAITLADLARVTVLRLPPEIPAAIRDIRTPPATPAGHPIPAGPTAATYSELLTLVAAGQGVFPIGAHARRYNARPDVAFVPIRDAPPVRWALLWRTAGEITAVREFARAAADIAA